MHGLMEYWRSRVDRLREHASAGHSGREVVTRSVEGPVVRTTYGDIFQRAKRLSGALLELGVKPGDRVATLAWNSARHVEAWYAVMGIGAVCHTLNPRLFAEQLCYIINHAGDKVLITDATFLPVLAEHRASMPGVERFIVLGEPGRVHATGFEGALASEALIEAHDADCSWHELDEQTASGLCYTSRTTGNPKDGLYSHRSDFLHPLLILQTDGHGRSARARVLPVV